MALEVVTVKEQRELAKKIAQFAASMESYAIRLDAAGLKEYTTQIRLFDRASADLVRVTNTMSRDCAKAIEAKAKETRRKKKK